MTAVPVLTRPAELAEWQLPAPRTFPATAPDHAAPLRAVDSFTIDGTYVVGRKRIVADDPYLSGHYPGFPIYPGVFSIETVFQTARQALAVMDPGRAPATIVAIDSVSFSAPLLPGDELTAACQLKPHPHHGDRTVVTARCARADGRPSARIKLQLGRLPVAGGARMDSVELNSETYPTATDVVATSDSTGGRAAEPATVRTVEHSGILAVLPHRHPVLQVDRVVELTPRRRIVATRAISGSEPCFAGLGADTPAAGFGYPVSLLVESMGQAGGLLWLLSHEPTSTPHGRPARPAEPAPMLIFGSARGLQVFGTAQPGDVLTHVVTLDTAKGESAMLSGSSYVAGRLIARVDTILAVLRGSTALTD